MARKILVVDDESDIRDELAEYLAHKGYRVVRAEDGSRAWTEFEARRADLILTDLRMPRMDGYELIRRVRSRDPDVPIIAITGQYSSGDLQSAIAAGATSTAKKPLSLRELGEQIRRLLEPTDE